MKAFGSVCVSSLLFVFCSCWFCRRLCSCFCLCYCFVLVCVGVRDLVGV